jgi:hypothetical protein
MFEDQYNEEMEQEVLRLEALKRATDAGHPEWQNACAGCGCQLMDTGTNRCERCSG